MHFQAFTPPDHLKPYVKYFYAVESHAEAPEQRVVRAIADGCPGIFFQHDDHGRFSQDAQNLPTTLLFGQSTRFNDLQLQGNFKAVGAYLQPHALHALLGQHADPMTDGCLDLHSLKRAKEYNISQRLLGGATAAEKVRALCTYLELELRAHASPDHAAMEYVLGKIIAGKGRMPLSILQQQLGLSERSLERKFKQFTGISPKLFSRICHFQASLKQLQKKEFDKLSDLAYENDYADQSHFIRSFRQFSGLTPNQYQQQSREVLENFTQLI